MAYLYWRTTNLPSKHIGGESTTEYFTNGDFSNDIGGGGDPEKGLHQNYTTVPRNLCPEDPDLFRLIVSGFGISIFSLFGIIGNILSIIVLTRPAFRTSSTSFILIGLAFADMTFLSATIFLSGVKSFVLYFCWGIKSYSLVYPVGVLIAYPLCVTARRCSIYFTLIVTLERFIIVYRPLMAKSYCTVKNAKRIVVIVAIALILYSLPEWWSFTYKYGYTNGTHSYNTVVVTPFGENVNFQLYYALWADIILFILGPVIILAILNIAIYVRLRQSNKMRKSMTQTESSEVSMTKMLVTIVTIFLICYSVIPFYQRVSQIIGGVHVISAQLSRVGLFLFNFNSFINFLIYCLYGKKFRKTFFELFECCKKVREKEIRNGNLAVVAGSNFSS